MKQIEKAFLVGLLVSFLGSLPPGLMNIVAVQIASEQGRGAAMLYSTGSMLAEVLTVGVVMSIMNWLLKRLVFFAVLEWVTVVLLGLFALGCFWVAGSTRDLIGLIPVIGLPAFFTGAVISLLNPMHIPFWLGWTSYLANKGIVPTGGRRRYYYMAGIAAGTMAGFAVYAYGGQPFFELLSANNAGFNYTLGTLLLVISLLQVRKLAVVPARARFDRMLKRR